MALYKTDKIKPVNFDKIPQEMKNIPQWFMWKAKDKGRNDGKLVKYPTDITGQSIAWNDTNNLYTFDEVKQAYENSTKFDGVSFNVTGNNITIIDIDLISDELTGHEKNFLNAGYVEKSVSGRGYHIILNGKVNHQDKNVYDSEGNKLEVFCSSGYVAITGDTYNNHSHIDNQTISSQFINYLTKHFSPKVTEIHTEAHTKTIDNLNSLIPPNLNKTSVLDLWYNTGNINLKTKNVSKKELWERSDKAMHSYNCDRSEASYSIISELAYFLWDKPNELYELIINNPYWNEKDNYMNDNKKRIRRDINKAITERKRRGKVYQVIEPPERDEQQSKLLEHYNKSNASNNLTDFENGIKANANTPPISTGFNLLDTLFNGGMREGLYVLGAISSLGKTTFVQHIADNVAQNSTDVLFISLEMARTELMSKSISRESYKETIENSNVEFAKTSIEISDGSKHIYFNDYERELMQTAIERYSEYAKRLYIIEAFGQIGYKNVRELVAMHREETGHTPIVIIDYLQILKPSDPRQTDKTNTDIAVNGLKQISRDYKTPVVAISSLNRESYNKPMSLSAFKESGAIEYSSDVLIGLDFTEMIKGTSNIDFEKEKDKVPREVTLTILKNRNGRTGGRINYLYDPRFNFFKEDDYYKKRNKKRTV